MKHSEVLIEISKLESKSLRKRLTKGYLNYLKRIDPMKDYSCPPVLVTRTELVEPITISNGESIVVVTTMTSSDTTVSIRKIDAKEKGESV